MRISSEDDEGRSTIGHGGARIFLRSYGEKARVVIVQVCGLRCSGLHSHSHSRAGTT